MPRTRATEVAPTEEVTLPERCASCSFTFSEATVSRREYVGHMTEVDGEEVALCRWCAAHNVGTCYECDERRLTSDMVYAYRDYGNDYATYCREHEHLFSECYNCGDYLANDDDGDPEPCSCQREDEDYYDGDDYGGWDFVPSTLKFHGSPSDKAYLGIEIEMECEGERQSEIAGRISGYGQSNWFAKHDGSLSCGVEMVSHPRSLDSWWDYYNDGTLPALCQELRGAGARSWNTSSAGIHIHISADAFTGGRHMLAFQYLVYRNEHSMTKFAGRSGSRWASFGDASAGAQHRKWIATYAKNWKSRQGYSCERYMAVNLQNARTVEIRMFRGSLNEERVMANLQLVHAAMTYTRDVTYADVKRGALNFDVFAYWMASRPEYRHASTLIQSRSIQNLDARS